MSSLKQEPKIFLARWKLMNWVGERQLFLLGKSKDGFANSRTFT